MSNLYHLYSSTTLLEALDMIKILLCEKVFTILSYLAAKSLKFLNIISAKNIYLSELYTCLNGLRKYLIVILLLNLPLYADILNSKSYSL